MDYSLTLADNNFQYHSLKNFSLQCSKMWGQIQVRFKSHQLQILMYKVRMSLWLFKWEISPAVASDAVAGLCWWQWFSNCIVHQTHWESSLKHKLLGPTYRVSDLVGTWVGPKFAFLTNSQVMLMLLTQGPLGEHWLGVMLDEQAL